MYSPTDGDQQQPEVRDTTTATNDERTSLLNNNNNYYDTPKKQDGWKLDPATKKFSLIIFAVVIGLTVAFSIVAHNNAKDGGNTPPHHHNFVYDECYSYRTFTLWKIWPASSGGNSSSLTPQQQRQMKTCVTDLKLTRGTPFACTTSIDCQINIPNYCLFGSSKFLECHAGFCAVKTASLPVSSEITGAGVCPLFDNVTDRCGDLLGNATSTTPSSSSSPSQQNVATKPVVCVTKKVCDDQKDAISCKSLAPDNQSSTTATARWSGFTRDLLLF